MTGTTHLTEEFLKTIFSQAGDGIFLVEDQKIIAANPRGCEMFGYTHEEIIGLPLMEQIPADELGPIVEKLGRLAQTGFVVAESAFYRKNGSRMEVEISGRLLSNGHILGIMRDITQRKEAEHARNHSEQKFRNLVEHSPDGIFLVDEQGTVVEWNLAQELITGLPRAEAMGKPVWDVQFNLVSQELRSEQVFESIKVFFQDLLEHGNRPELTHLREEVVQRPGVGPRYLEIMLYVYKTERGHRVGGIARDVTRRKQSELALREAQSTILKNERSMASFEERERLARELHDSIGQTFGYLNMQTEAIRELIGQGEMARAMQLLARLSEVAQESHRDLRTYIQGLKNNSAVLHPEFFIALDRYCQHYEQSYLFRVQLNLPVVMPVVLASAQVETHLTYIIREAIGNARRYSGVQQATVTIGVDDEYVQAIIEDQGIGFDSHFHIVERRQGTHFGLRIMLERAEEVGGVINVESAPGQGTRVIVRLPRKLSEGNPLTARILVVDDHPLFIEGLRNMLAARGARVIGAGRDGVEACELARALQPDLILMDINMPRMNGLQATRQIKSEFPEIKVAMLTTSIAEEDVLEALEMGASGYLPKGMNTDQFMERLGEIARGEADFSVVVANQLLELFGHKNSDLSKLSKRQVEILRLVGRGLTYREIGDRLYLTERTVKYHMGEILTRLHLKKREDAEDYARRRGLA